MKRRKILLILLVSIFSTSLTNAQFLKKLQKRVELAAEEAVIRKIEQKVNQKTGEGMDKILDADVNKMFNKKFGGMSAVDPSILPESYEFEWKYSMQIQSKEGTFIMNYFLKPQAKYFGAKPEIQQSKSKGNMFTVMDFERDVNTVFMDLGSSKTATPMSMPKDMGLEVDDDQSEEYTFEEIGTKEILGYQSQGFKMENDEALMIIYVAMDAPVSFTQIFGVNTKNIPKGFNPKWLDKADNSLVMEMEYTDKKTKKNSSKMVVTALNQEPFSILKKDYQFMNLNVPSSEKEIKFK
jgi:Domain of unknown function (DUF4412)